MSPLHRKTDDPLGQFGWRSRRDWRRAARHILADHQHELMARLNNLLGSPVRGVVTTPAGTVRLTLPGWAITMVEVAASARADLSAVTARYTVSLADAGRYGPFWWVAVACSPPVEAGRPVILSSRLVLTRTEHGDSPPAAAWLPADSTSPTWALVTR
jgi:hypothetical protein